jgi:hypothetical protein
MASKIFFSSTSYTDAALAEAGRFARQILNSPDSGMGSSSIRHDHYHWGSPGWSGYPFYPAYNTGIGERSSKEKKDHSWIAIPAAAIALATLYFIGQNHAEWSQAAEAITKLQRQAKRVQAELSHSHPSIKRSVQAVFEKEMEILDQIRSNALIGLALKSALVVSVIIAGIGALASGGVLFFSSCESLLGYGSLSAFITSCGIVYRAGFNSYHSTLHAEAEELQLAVNRAAWALKTLRV